MVKRYRLLFTGRVQGVGFRWRNFRYARQHGLSGWVQNQDDGTVLLEIEGEEEKLKKFMQYLKNNPGYAVITSQICEEIKPEGDKKFIIRYKLW